MQTIKITVIAIVVVVAFGNLVAFNIDHIPRGLAETVIGATQCK